VVDALRYTWTLLVGTETYVLVSDSLDPQYELAWSEIKPLLRQEDLDALAAATPVVLTTRVDVSDGSTTIADTQTLTITNAAPSLSVEDTFVVSLGDTLELTSSITDNDNTGSERQNLRVEWDFLTPVGAAGGIAAATSNTFEVDAIGETISLTSSMLAALGLTNAGDQITVIVRGVDELGATSLLSTVTLVVPGISADFNDDGAINGFDFLLWQRGFGKTSGATKSDGDTDNDGDVDADDLGVWESQFGQTETTPALLEPALLALALPEPTLPEPAPLESPLDGFSFLAWQRGFGQPSGATASDGDFDGDTDVDADDLIVWAKRFGSSNESTTQPAAAAFTIEPAPSLVTQPSITQPLKIQSPVTQSLRAQPLETQSLAIQSPSPLVPFSIEVDTTIFEGPAVPEGLTSNGSSLPPRRLPLPSASETPVIARATREASLEETESLAPVTPTRLQASETFGVNLTDFYNYVSPQFYTGLAFRSRAAKIQQADQAEQVRMRQRAQTIDAVLSRLAMPWQIVEESAIDELIANHQEDKKNRNREQDFVWDEWESLSNKVSVRQGHAYRFH